MTDGIFDGAKSAQKLHEDVFQHFCRKVNEIAEGFESGKYLTSIPLTLQFVLYGDNPDAIKKLQALDDMSDINDTDGLKDSIDLKPATASAHDILLCTHIQDFDHMDFEVYVTQTSSTAKDGA